jgi:exodeoxyribonuclease VII large subunit
MPDLFSQSAGASSGASSSSSSEPVVLSVSALTSGLREAVEAACDDVRVEGELSNFTRAASGHCYFTLKDADAQIRCVMWRWLAKHVYFHPTDGQRVRVRGFASVYERRGDLQLQVKSMKQAGAGAMQAAFERLKRALEAEGLFDAARKRPLPAFPRVVGLVTSGTGAARHDVTSVLARRFPAAHVVLAPVRVQGLGAAEAIARALARFDALPEGDPHRPDVLIVGRGGGSAEDLWAFNEEVVARAVAACSVPVVSAVGHETDVAITDFVADRRAATPSMAAEIVAPDRRAVSAAVVDLHDRLHAAVTGAVATTRRRVERLTARRAFHKPAQRLRQAQQRLDDLAHRLPRAAAQQIERAHARLARLRAQLDALDPERPLRRGYAWVARADADATPVRRADALAPGDRLRLHFADGARAATVGEDDQEGR